MQYVLFTVYCGVVFLVGYQSSRRQADKCINKIQAENKQALEELDDVV